MEHKAWPYVAGIIDSEGCICIAKGRSPGITKAQTKLVISVGNTDVRLMRWLVENFGGVFLNRLNHRGFSAQSGCGYLYTWNVPSTRREWFLCGVRPYLILKRGQSDVMLRYISIGNTWDVETRIRLSEECKSLNHQVLDDEYLGHFSTSQEVAAYAAGMMDGDGSFYIGMANLSPVVGITAKSPRIVRWFYRNFGGRITLPSVGGRPYCGWRLSGCRNKQSFVLQILPYLKLKREQAKILLLALQITGEHNAIEQRKSFALQLRALNRPRESVTTETQGEGEIPSKIQSELTGNRESVPMET